MKILIPSLGRADSQLTLTQMKAAGIQTTLVVRPQEEHLYAKWCDELTDMAVLPDAVHDLAATRQWCTENFYPEDIFWMDDDMLFYVRPGTPIDDRLYYCESDDMATMMRIIERSFEHYAHVGISLRQGNNRKMMHFHEAGNMGGCIGVKTKIVMDHGLRYDRNIVMEDKHMILSLLELGYPNIVWYYYCCGQKGSNTAGGCSTYRTADMQRESAELLAADHPGFVKVTQKKTKGGWFGGDGTRWDVVCSWQKAFASYTGEPRYV